MNPAEIDALVASVQAAKAAGQPVSSATSASSAEPMVSQLAELERMAASGGEVPLAMLFSLTLPISIELGRTNMTVQELLRLGRGSVIQLERLAGEPIDILVGDRRFAEGEVVVLGEHFGVRVTRILTRSWAGGADAAAGAAGSAAA